MTTLRLSGASLERAAARLGIPAPEEPKQPAITSQEAQRRRRAAIVAFHRRLAADSPNTFAPPNHAPLHPLKIGIDHDIRERYPDVPLKTRRAFIRSYVQQVGYLRLLVAGTARVGLDGMPSGEVTEDQARNAVERRAARAGGQHA